jgi:alkanesulfonate monooxygenase SsuD/methylene tetrahydromethanopterin reductase-like flavin-dependent oxidoreductase (luciferase family)
MRKVSLGLFNLMGLHDANTSAVAVARTTVDAVKMAEDFGFETAWFAEHHFTNHSVCPSALLMISHAAAHTSRIKLGAAVLALPFHNPLLLVEEITFVDLLTRGRLVLGLGCGYQPYEMARFGVELDSRHRVMLEIWDIIEKGLESGRIDHKGEFYEIAPTELAMRPVTLNGPAFYIVSSHPDIVARAARYGHTPFMSFGHRGLQEALEHRAKIATRWEAATGSSERMPLAVQRYIYVTQDKADAEHAARCVRDLARADRAFTAPHQGPNGSFPRLMPLNDEAPLDDFLEKAVIGPPDYCAAKLRTELEALKPTHLSCFMGFAGIGRRETLASLERFGCEVIPLLSDLLALDADIERDVA